MWLGKFTEGTGIKVYNTLLRGETETLAENTDNNKGKVVTSILKISNKILYTKLIIYQE